MPRVMNTTKIIAALREFFAQERRLPGYNEMLRIFGYRSKNSVFLALRMLEERGYVVKGPHGKISPTAKLDGAIRILGTVQAGIPVDAEQLTDARTVQMEKFLAPHPDRSFLLEAIDRMEASEETSAKRSCARRKDASHRYCFPTCCRALMRSKLARMSGSIAMSRRETTLASSSSDCVAGLLRMRAVISRMRRSSMGVERRPGSVMYQGWMMCPGEEASSTTRKDESRPAVQNTLTTFIMTKIGNLAFSAKLCLICINSEEWRRSR